MESENNSDKESINELLDSANTPNKETGNASDEEKPEVHSKKKLGKRAKIIIAIVAVVLGLMIAWTIYAAIISNIDNCFPGNNYCKGVFPFYSGDPDNDIPNYTPSTKCYKTNGRCIIPDEKPVIYLYPDREMNVSVSLGYPEKLSASYPKYDKGWHVLANPNGSLVDLNSGRELYSLYWEGKDARFEVSDTGFVVAGSETASFLEDKLAKLGLNEREVEEFIIYWLPRMQKNNYNYVRFASAEEINEYMPLETEPKADTVIRVMMITKPLEYPIDVNEQKIVNTPQRTGFTVVEWGGSELTGAVR